MVVIWLAQAQKDLDEIWDYYSVRSLPSAIKIIRSIKLTESILSTAPRVGSVELLLDDRPESFRKLIRGNYKIIYHIEGETVYISTIFDCRRNPVTLRKITAKAEA
jgi:plasmid stabilization system protein ParE